MKTEQETKEILNNLNDLNNKNLEIIRDKTIEGNIYWKAFKDLIIINAKIEVLNKILE